MRILRIATPIAAFAAAALLLTGCVNNSVAAPESSGPATVVAKDDAAAKLVPAKIVKAGVLEIGTDATYAPNEFKDSSGKAIGWEIELADAMAAKLGLKTNYHLATFDHIIPSITGGKYDVGLSSFFDTVDRQKVVDFADYYSAGVQWASPAGTTVDPTNACGLKLAVQNGTTQALEDTPAKSKECTDAGKPAITALGYDSQDDATAAVALGRADATSADSPVTQYAVKQSKGKLVLAGPVYNSFFYGMPVAKGNGTLVKALEAALVSLKKDGTYTTILTKWGVEKGALSDIGINLAKS